MRRFVGSVVVVGARAEAGMEVSGWVGCVLVRKGEIREGWGKIFSEDGKWGNETEKKIETEKIKRK